MLNNRRTAYWLRDFLGIRIGVKYRSASHGGNCERNTPYMLGSWTGRNYRKAEPSEYDISEAWAFQLRPSSLLSI